MQEPNPQLTIDDAVAQFQMLLRDKLDSLPGYTGASGTETPAEAEARRFHLAELLIGLVCPDPRACTDQHCRRNVACRHFERVRAKRASGTAAHPRRTPGAEATRYAIWAFMSSGR